MNLESDRDVAQLDHGRNMCAKFELLPAYSKRSNPDKVAAAAHPARRKTIPARP